MNRFRKPSAITQAPLMQAIVQNGYGSEEVLALAQLKKPVPGDRDVLVRIHAASLHAGDIILQRGIPYPARFYAGWPKPKDFVPGRSVAGTVEQVGASVTTLEPGDEVYGECRGACAEHGLGTEMTLVGKPVSLTFEQAAAIPTSALAAQHGLRAAQVKPGQRILITGASGGVGLFAVQIAKAMGAHVTAVCSTSNIDMVRRLGADDVIDYTTDDFTHAGPRYDLIFDNVGQYSFRTVRGALKPDGIVIPNAGTSTPRSMIGGMLRSLIARQKDLRFISKPSRAKLLALSALVDTGKLVPVIDRTYRLDQTRQAMVYVGTRHARGKVVISVLTDPEPHHA